ncbi:MAG: HEAT repeat domain-containing protein [Planctomycetota bacterium]
MIRFVFSTLRRPVRAVPAALLLASAATAQTPEAELFATIQKRGDRTPHALYEELAELGSARAFEALESALDEVNRLWSQRAIFHSMRHFLGDETLGPKALATIERHARSGEGIRARAAAGALAGFGPPAHDALYDVARGAGEPIARAHAIRGLRTTLGERGDDDALALVLKGWITPHSGTREQGVELLRSFTTDDAFQRLERFVASSRASQEVQRIVLIALGGHPRGEDDALDEHVDGVLGRALGSSDAALRYEALQAIDARGGTSEPRRVEKAARDRDPTVRRAALVLLMDIDATGVDFYRLAKSSDAIERQAAAIGLAEDPAPEALAALHRLLRDDDPTVRVEAIHQTGRRRERSSIPELIDRLAAETGRLRTDARHALTMLTARDLGFRLGAWRDFWRQEGETFPLPTYDEALAAAEERGSGPRDGGSSVAFYGLDVVSNRFALVVDTSGSMKERAYAGKRRIEVAKEEIQRTLERIRDGVAFNVIPFSDEARPLHDGVVQVSDDARDEAIAFSNALRPVGGTNVHDALAAAFDDPEIDTIYLLTDGEPSVGEIVEPAFLRDEIARWNSVRGVRIHCIAVGKNSELLEGIASDSGGLYRRVN